MNSNDGKPPTQRRLRLPLSRRQFCLGCAWGSVAAGLAGTAYATGRFLAPRVLYEPPAIFRAGRPEDYPMGTVSEAYKEQERVWLVRRPQGLYALVAVCTHLGCTPNWIEGEGLFKCPCHGSVFTPEGDVVAGPAPEPLYRAPLTLDPDGRLVVGTGVLGIRLPGQANRTPRREGPEYVVKA